MTETKQGTGKVLEELNKIEKNTGTEILEIKVEDLQISKNDLSLKEIILKANEHYYKKEYNEAIRWYDKAIEIDTGNVDAWNNKGYAFDVLGKYEEAIECCDKALKINPNFAVAWYNRACYKVKKEDIDNGLDDLKKAIEIGKEIIIESAKQDKDFETIRNDDRFKKLIPS